MARASSVLSSILLVVGLAATGVGCSTASPAPTAAAPTAAPSPAAAAPAAPSVAATTKAADAPTAKPAIQWIGDKLQPMPDGFPTKTITLYSGFQPGHGSDIYLRLLAEVAKRHSPVPVVADNRVAGPRLYWDLLGFWETQPGGTEGYALGEVAFKGATARSLTVDISPYTYQDVNPVIQTEFKNHAFGVRGDDDRFKTIQDLIQWAKANPKKLKIGASAVGSNVHLSSMLLAKAAGFEFTYLPHSGGTAALLTLLGGGVDMVDTPLSDFVPRPELRVLLLSGDQRPSGFPNIPLATDLGYNIPLYTEQGVFTHPKVPPARVAWLHELLKKAAQSPEYEKRLKDSGAFPVMLGPEQLRKGMDETAKLVEPLVMELGLHKSQITKK